MIDKIIFYNHYGNGDVHYSREFVKDIMQKIPAETYEYYHRHNIGLLKDIQDLNSFNNVNSLTYDKQKQVYLGNEIAVNTWVGQKSAMYLTDDCSMYSNYNMFKDIYKQLNIKLEDIDYYIPTIDFNFTENKGIDNFINNNSKLKILFSNGNVFSGQVQNFSFDYVIDKLSNKFKDVQFIVTHDSNIKRDNIINVSDIIETKNNLNEIAYLSTFCDIIIGRASGPYCFTQIKDNFFDEDMTFISFSNKESEGKYYGYLNLGKKPLCKQIHSSTYDRTMVDIIKNEI